ncbi:hypothetical protein RJ641_014096 [Dillenia turbinata]|uniref:Uncharacterized protein n=1 Tax=Dillenia turbinata TaxID=194707 RepID=A0AAN8WDW1_9MAGN
MIAFQSGREILISQLQALPVDLTMASVLGAWEDIQMKKM